MKPKNNSVDSDWSSDFRQLSQFDDHEMLIATSDKKSKLRGYIGIHNTNRGPALGGTRMQIYRSEEEALIDVLRLSSSMSYKCALANLPYGGGKAVLVANDINDREEALKAYSRSVEKLGGLFKTGTDVGMTDDDVAYMSKHTEHMLGTTEADRGTLSTSKVAAMGVYYSIQACADFKWGSEHLDDKIVGIKGVGKLGGELARLLDASGAKVLVSDVDNEKTKALKETYPKIEIVSNDEIQSIKMDIFAPCALGSEFSADGVTALKCEIICGGANNQLADSHAGLSIFKSGIIYAPDYIANAGGLIYVADELEPEGFNKERVISRTKEIQPTLKEVLRRSSEENSPTHVIADEIARERIGNTR